MSFFEFAKKLCENGDADLIHRGWRFFEDAESVVHLVLLWERLPQPLQLVYKELLREFLENSPDTLRIEVLPDIFEKLEVITEGDEILLELIHNKIHSLQFV